MGRSKSLEILAQALRSSFDQVGPRQSQRMALKLLSIEDRHFSHLMEAMREARRRVLRCDFCQDFSEAPRCSLCSDPGRDRSSLCVVENPPDVEALEASRSYHGLYHVLHGSLDARAEARPTAVGRLLTLPDLWARLKTDGAIREVILALDQDTPGELTSLYLAREIGRNFPNLRVTRIGVGIPFGGEVLYSDPLTVRQALLTRTQVRAAVESEKETAVF